MLFGHLARMDKSAEEQEEEEILFCQTNKHKQTQSILQLSART